MALECDRRCLLFFGCTYKAKSISLGGFMAHLTGTKETCIILSLSKKYHKNA